MLKKGLPPMNSITLGKQVYTIPFGDLLPDLSTEDYRKLKDDIAQRGVIVPVIVDEDHAVIDGQHRLKIASELGLDSVPLEIRAGLSDDEKRAMAWDLNEHRRHMTPEQRQARVEPLAKQGMSAGAIADKLNVDTSTVSRDITGIASARPVTGAIREVVGKDGKKYRYQPKAKPIRTDTDQYAAQQKLLEAIPQEYRTKALGLCGAYMWKVRKLMSLYKSAGSPQTNGTFFEIMATGGFHYGDDMDKWCDFTNDSIEKIEKALKSLAKHHAREARTDRQQHRAKVISELPKSVYNVIAADCPWSYNNTGVHGAASSHYETMPTDDICGYLEKTGIAVADNAVLFLWVTNPTMPDAFKVIESWDFQYKTNMVWVKTELKKPGSGFYVRGRHELLFICTRGSMTPLVDVSPPIGSVVHAPIDEHSSKKPDEFYKIIERLYPGCNYLELFARERRVGWEVLGDEIS
jgi:N6-adenosine-specific RNA methylase IME4